MNTSSISSEIGSTLQPTARKQPSSNAGGRVAVAASSETSNQTTTLPAGQATKISPSRSGANAPVTPVVNGIGLGLRFLVDKETGTKIIKVIDLESGDVVRQIPSEEIVAFLRQFQDRKGALLSIKL